MDFPIILLILFIGLIYPRSVLFVGAWYFLVNFVDYPTWIGYFFIPLILIALFVDGEMNRRVGNS
jgi:hypothetical protein